MVQCIINMVGEKLTASVSDDVAARSAALRDSGKQIKEDCDY